VLNFVIGLDIRIILIRQDRLDLGDRSVEALAPGHVGPAGVRWVGEYLEQA